MLMSRVTNIVFCSSVDASKDATGVCFSVAGRLLV